MRFPALANVVISISSETAPDVDLRILDSNENRIGSSAGPDSNESVAFTNLPAGIYFLVVDGYKASTPGGTDEVTMNIASILPTDESLSDDVTVAVDESEGEFSLTFDWDTDNNTSGIVILTSGDQSNEVQIPLNITRKNDVTHFHTLSDAMTAGVASRVGFNVAPNFSDEDREYSFSAQMSAGHKVANISNGGVQEGNTINWTVVQEASSGEAMVVGFDLIPTKAGSAYAMKLTNEFGDDMVEETVKFGVTEVAPVAMASAPDWVTEGLTVNISGAASYDGNDDELSYQWLQTGGATVLFDKTAESFSFNAPSVGSQGDTLSFELTVTDTNGNSDTTNAVVSVSEAAELDKGGSIGWVGMLLLPVVWMRRKLKA
ncbi:pre-peptidase C-terminal domain-containing protein [Shewanella pneumatophori]|uniref:Pre-peptidase C-terminal domain-containing protein n=2 Tax=Shewanella pneumatophori TaxID=314092 RepID=A0A9X2CIS5_9GAMM|nr:pre-peptidase C-terminal domain-containing protein [Shewanella pneumatophori]